MKTLGFIGTGGMGSGMAANLIKAGYSLVINDLRREAARTLENQGAVFKDSPAAVAESCETVLSMLPYNEAVNTVGLGKGGLHEARGGARLWVDFSSIDKKTIVGVNDELKKHGWTLLDGSAGGVEEAAAAGTLSLWISGSKELFDQHMPVFQAMGKTVTHEFALGVTTPQSHNPGDEARLPGGSSGGSAISIVTCMAISQRSMFGVKDSWSMNELGNGSSQTVCQIPVVRGYQIR